jgi:hypothetical protein
MTILRKALLGASFVAAATCAQAGTIDFTSAATHTSGTVDGINWTMTTNVGTLNNSQLFDGQDSLPALSGTGLALQKDGYGVRSSIDNASNDDEITTVRAGMEAITISFSRPVYFTGIAFLDLFVASGSKIGEVGHAVLSDGTTFAISATDLANSGGSKRAGYAALSTLGVITNQVRIYMGLTNDQQGFADGALASVSVAPVPVPAAGLMLLGGLGGLSALRRKRKTA